MTRNVVNHLKGQSRDCCYEEGIVVYELRDQSSDANLIVIKHLKGQKKCLKLM